MGCASRVVESEAQIIFLGAGRGHDNATNLELFTIEQICWDERCKLEHVYMRLGGLFAWT